MNVDDLPAIRMSPDVPLPPPRMLRDLADDVAQPISDVRSVNQVARYNAHVFNFYSLGNDVNR